MDNLRIKPEQLSEAIGGLLDEYSEQVTNVLRVETKKVANDFKKDTVSSAKGYGWNEYSGSIATKKNEDTKTAFSMTWYVKSPHYRLTHLLEYGHAIANKYGTYAGRTTAFGFLHEAYPTAEKNYLEAIRRGINEIR